MKRITTKGSGLSKNIRASLWINTLSPSQSPVPVGGDDLPLLRARHDQEPPAPLQQQQQQQHPVHPRRHHDPLHHNHHPQQQPSAQATARQASLAGYAGFEIGDAGLLPPLSFQVKNPQPSFMVVTPAHLRRPGPHSPGLAHAPALPGADAAYSPSSRSHSTATLSDARLSPPPPPSRPRRKGREKMPAAAVRSEITIAVRVKPAIAPARWPQWMSSGSDRPCLLIERPRPAPRGGGSGLFAEAVTPRQMQTLALLEKLENKRDAGGVGENGDIGGGNLPAGDAGGAKTKLFVTVPRFVQGAISTTTTTRKFSSFDHVFDGDASQSDVYAGISSLVDGLLSEIASADNPKAANCLTFVASGYPSAGKSYTLFGPAHNDDDDDAAAQRKTPQVPAKRSSSRPSLMPHEVELAQPTDGLLQRAVARILASSAGPVSMSFAQLVRVFDAPWMQSARESEHVVDLLTGEEKHGIERENFWEALAKAHVRSLPDVNHWLQEGRRLAGNDDRHVVVAFEFSAPGGRTRRLVMVDAAVENMQQSTPPLSAVSMQRWTSAPGTFPLDTIFTDTRFVAEKMVLIANVGQQPDDASETMATLVSADELKKLLKINAKRRKKLDLIQRLESSLNLQEREGGFGAATRGVLTPEPSPARTTKPGRDPSPPPPSDRGARPADAGRGDGVLRSRLREERNNNRSLRQKLEGLADGLDSARQELARSRMRERELMLDVSATQGTLMELARERDLEQAALLEARAAAVATQEKWSSTIEECKTLRRVISGLTAPRRIGFDGRLVRAAAGNAVDDVESSVAKALESLATRHAEARAETEKLRSALGEKDRQLEKFGRMLLRERRLCVQLRVRLGDESRDISSDEDDGAQSYDEQQQPQPQPHPPQQKQRAAVGFATVISPPAAPSTRRSLPSVPGKVGASHPPPNSARKASLPVAAAATRPPSRALDVSHGFPLNSIFEPARLAAANEAASRPEDISRRVSASEADCSGGGGGDEDEAEWEALMENLEQQDDGAKDNLGVLDDRSLSAGDLPAELQSEAEWEAMLSRFEQEEKRRTPAIRHRIYTAKFADAAY